MDEGYIKFHCNWKKTDPLSPKKLDPINSWRKRLFEHKLIGVYRDGIGYGNISIRNGPGKFIISGSATGSLAELDENHYVEVIDYDVEQNSVTCSGPIIASSESMTHALIYERSPETQAVIHVHNMKIWKNYLHKVPTTRPNVPYGTPEMAYEIERLFEETDVKTSKILVMAGHEEGIITFGGSLDEAGKILFDHF